MEMLRSFLDQFLSGGYNGESFHFCLRELLYPISCKRGIT